MRATPVMLAVLMPVGILAAAATAGAGGEIERWTKLRQEREERLQAQQAMMEQARTWHARRQTVAQLEKLKAGLERDLAYHQLKWDRAVKELALLQRMQPPDPEAVAGQEKDAAYYQARLQVLRADLAKAESALARALEELKAPAVSSGQVILPGEVLEVTVLETDTFNGLYQVRNGGFIVLPHVGRVQVAGKSLAAAERAIKEAIETYLAREPSVGLGRSPGARSAAASSRP